ncbi:MAG TPA: hypothetical protein PLP29_12135 [Candidatus Ozemobacteraceae bacterium]|nr:hypothetical protein [Candidatus Ozemobacteraceae bacterium]
MNRFSGQTTRSTRGMALVIVLAIATALLVMGASYLSTFSQSRSVNPKILEKVQADLLATGLQKIALLKFKRFPEDFYHSCFFQFAWDDPVKRPALFNYSPTPLEVFHGDPILRNGDAAALLPLSVFNYTTTYRLLSHRAYTRDSVEILVALQMTRTSPVQTYALKVDATRITER